MGNRVYVLFFLSLVLVMSNIEITYAVDPPSELIVVRAADNSLWKATCSGYDQICTEFTSFPGMFASTPTVVWDEKKSNYVVWGRATDGSIWKASFSKGGGFNNDWVVVPGNTPSQIGAAGSTMRVPLSEWIDSGSIDVSTLSTDCNNMTNLGNFSHFPLSFGYVNITASGIYAPGLANKWVRVCLSSTSGGGTCDSLGPFLESSIVGPEYEGEKRFTLNYVRAASGDSFSYSYLKACRETGATGALYWDDVIGIYIKY